VKVVFFFRMKNLDLKAIKATLEDGTLIVMHLFIFKDTECLV